MLAAYTIQRALVHLAVWVLGPATRCHRQTRSQVISATDFRLKRERLSKYRLEIAVGMTDRVCSLMCVIAMGAHMPDEKKIENLRTLHEAAEYMKLKPRTLAKAAKKIGACSIFGREIYFSENDIKSIWEAHRAKASASNSEQLSLSNHQVMKKLKKLLTKKRK